MSGNPRPDEIRRDPQELELEPTRSKHPTVFLVIQITNAVTGQVQTIRAIDTTLELAKKHADYIGLKNENEFYTHVRIEQVSTNHLFGDATNRRGGNKTR